MVLAVHYLIIISVSYSLLLIIGRLPRDLRGQAERCPSSATHYIGQGPHESQSKPGRPWEGP